VLLTMPRQPRPETLGRQSFFQRMCGRLAPSRRHRPLLGTIEHEDIIEPLVSPSWANGCANSEEIVGGVEDCPDRILVTLVGLSGDVLWGPQPVRNKIVFGNLRRLVSQALLHPADSLSIVHDSIKVDMSSELDIRVFGSQVQFSLIKQEFQAPYAQGVLYEPGCYQLTHGVILSSGLSTSSADIKELPGNTMIRVRLALLIEEEQRIRGHVCEYKSSCHSTANACDGWISLATTHPALTLYDHDIPNEWARQIDEDFWASDILADLTTWASDI